MGEQDCLWPAGLATCCHPHVIKVFKIQISKWPLSVYCISNMTYIYMYHLHSDFNTGSLTPVELTAVDVLDKAMEHCRNCMVSEGPDHNTLNTHTYTHIHTYMCIQSCAELYVRILVKQNSIVNLFVCEVSLLYMRYSYHMLNL